MSGTSSPTSPTTAKSDVEDRALIGKGSSGNIYQCVDKKGRAFRAVKEIPLPPSPSSDPQRAAVIKILNEEVAALKHLDHDNILKYYDFLVDSGDPDRYKIFMTYIPGGSLRELLDNFGAFEEGLARTFSKQILTGLQYLHSRSIIHRDVRSSHILVDSNGVIKLIGFGLTRSDDQSNTTTPNARGHRRSESSLQRMVFWRSPELTKSAPYSATTDIWSTGCVMLEMVNGVHPWAPLTPLQAIFQLGSGVVPALPEDISDPLKACLQRMLVVDPQQRPSAASVLKNAWFDAV